MTLIRALPLILSLLISACGPRSLNFPGGGGGKSTSFTQPSSEGTSGAIDTKTGSPYVHNGDKRVDETLKAQGITTPSAPVAGSLQDRLVEFEITRYNDDDIPTRFGAKRVRMKFFFTDTPAIEFTGSLKNVSVEVPGGGHPQYEFVLPAVNGYSVTGYLEDIKDNSKEFQQSKGWQLRLTAPTGESAEIFYWAYKAKLNVREDKGMKIPGGSPLAGQVNALREGAFGWVHNWTVLQGHSFYLVDVVRRIRSGQTVETQALLAIKGQSLQTGDGGTHSTTTTGADEAELVGNAETEPGRIFSLLFTDPGTKQQHEIMVDVEIDESRSPVNQENPIGDTYLKFNDALPRTSKMNRDFNANFNVPTVQDVLGVQDLIKEYTYDAKVNGVTDNSDYWSRHRELMRFFHYANPYRSIMETLGNSFDVSPAYVYLTVVESRYFTGGKYEIQRPLRKDGSRISSALGPFQLLYKTAKGYPINMHVFDPADNSADERRYFVPSACGAARYMRYLVNLFDDSDSTLAILGYFQGQGGAAAAINCMYDPEVKDKAACVQRIGKSTKKGGFGGSDYERFVRMAKNFSYKYHEMAKHSAGLTKEMRRYVNRKLAVYFIANNMQKYGFSVASNAPRGFKWGMSVMPERALNDKECQGFLSGTTFPKKPKS